MLPQILHACVHQFYRIQGATSLLRRACCMGCNAVELILGLNAGIGGTGGYLIDVLRVPGQRRVQTLPDAVPRHKSLGSAALFARTAVQDYGAFHLILFQISLHADGCCHSTGTQDVVAASVTAAAFLQRFLFGASSRLRQTGKRVILRQNADHRTSASIACGKRSLNAANALFHMESFLFQHLTV